MSKYLAGTLTSALVLSITAFLTSTGVVCGSATSLASFNKLFASTSLALTLGSDFTSGCFSAVTSFFTSTVCFSTGVVTFSTVFVLFSINLDSTAVSICLLSTFWTTGALSNCLSLACASPPPTITKIQLAIAADTTPTLTFLIAHFVKFSDFIKLFFICIILLLLILYYQNFLFDEYSIPYRY